MINKSIEHKISTSALKHIIKVAFDCWMEEQALKTGLDQKFIGAQDFKDYLIDTINSLQEN